MTPGYTAGVEGLKKIRADTAIYPDEKGFAEVVEAVLRAVADQNVLEETQTEELVEHGRTSATEVMYAEAGTEIPPDDEDDSEVDSGEFRMPRVPTTLMFDMWFIDYEDGAFHRLQLDYRDVERSLEHSLRDPALGAGRGSSGIQ